MALHICQCELIIFDSGFGFRRFVGASASFCTDCLRDWLFLTYVHTVYLIFCLGDEEKPVMRCVVQPPLHEAGCTTIG